MASQGGTSGDLAASLSETLDTPLRTVVFYGDKLRAAGLLSQKGHGRGAAKMTARDAAVWLVALVIDHERGGDFLREVKRTLALPAQAPTLYPANIGDGLELTEAKTAGAALTALLSDIFDPRFVAVENHNILSIQFDSSGQSVMFLFHNGRELDQARFATWIFEKSGFNDQRKLRNIDRSVTINGRVFAKIGALLGLEPALPI